MCGRYSFTPTDDFDRHFHLVDHPVDLKPNNNIFPGSVMPVITSDRQNHLSLMSWGLIPPWAADPKIAFHLFNARSETVASKPAFRDCFRRYRCLVPATGFFEKSRYFSLKDHSLFAFAGLYVPSTQTYTIITTAANEVVKPVHDRMPVILEPKNESSWLNPEAAPALLSSLLMTNKSPLGE